MFFPFVPMVLAAQLVTVADEVPRFNIDSTCRTTVSRNLTACKEDEQAAHEQLIKQWAQFSPSDRASCVSLASEGDAHSYVQLLTCLEVARDAKPK